VIGETINNYRVTGLLGEGGMGTVYVAEHPFIGRKAAIKVLKQELCQQKHLVDRFMNEARAANAVGHPNIIDVIDVGLLPSGVPYLMMEYLDGESVARRIAREPRLSVAETVEIAAQTASALEAAHRKGIVHRDLKPDNLYLIGKGPIRIKVLDFGIAKLREDLSSGGTRTRDGSILGTPPYMSPEQCRGIMSAVDHRTDVYAMGIILYEMLNGAPPFVSDGWGDLLIMHVTKPPPPLRPRNPAVSAELERVIMKALAKTPEERWSSMAELEVALRGLAPAPVASGPTPVATLLLPTAAPSSPAATTLRTATGQIATSRESISARPSRRGSGLVAGGLVLAVGAAVAVFAIRPSRELPPAKAPVAEPVAAAAASALAPAAVAPAPTVPAALAPAPFKPAPVAGAAKASPPRAASASDKRLRATHSSHRSIAAQVRPASAVDVAPPPSAAPPQQDSPLKRGANNAPIIR
jgi:serine/threonine protein kinase